MRKPNAPKTKTPIAETFATVLYSMADGFFKISQTRLDWTMNDLIVAPNEKNIVDWEYF